MRFSSSLGLATVCLLLALASCLPLNDSLSSSSIDELCSGSIATPWFCDIKLYEDNPLCNYPFRLKWNYTESTKRLSIRITRQESSASAPTHSFAGFVQIKINPASVVLNESFDLSERALELSTLIELDDIKCARLGLTVYGNGSENSSFHFKSSTSNHICLGQCERFDPIRFNDIGSFIQDMLNEMYNGTRHKRGSMYFPSWTDISSYMSTKLSALNNSTLKWIHKKLPISQKVEEARTLKLEEDIMAKIRQNQDKYIVDLIRQDKNLSRLVNELIHRNAVQHSSSPKSQHIAEWLNDILIAEEENKVVYLNETSNDDVGPKNISNEISRKKRSASGVLKHLLIAKNRIHSGIEKSLKSAILSSTTSTTVPTTTTTSTTTSSTTTTQAETTTTQIETTTTTETSTVSTTTEMVTTTTSEQVVAEMAKVDENKPYVIERLLPIVLEDATSSTKSTTTTESTTTIETTTTTEAEPEEELTTIEYQTVSEEYGYNTPRFMFTNQVVLNTLMTTKPTTMFEEVIIETSPESEIETTTTSTTEATTESTTTTTTTTTTSTTSTTTVSTTTTSTTSEAPPTTTITISTTEEIEDTTETTTEEADETEDTEEVEFETEDTASQDVKEPKEHVVESTTQSTTASTTTESTTTSTTTTTESTTIQTTTLEIISIPSTKSSSTESTTQQTTSSTTTTSSPLVESTTTIETVIFDNPTTLETIIGTMTTEEPTTSDDDVDENTTMIEASSTTLPIETTTPESTTQSSTTTTTTSTTTTTTSTTTTDSIKLEIMNYTVLQPPAGNNESAVTVAKPASSAESKTYSLRLHIKGFKWNEKYNDPNSEEAQNFLKSQILPLLFKNLNLKETDLNEIKLIRLFKALSSKSSRDAHRKHLLKVSKQQIL